MRHVLICVTSGFTGFMFVLISILAASTDTLSSLIHAGIGLFFISVCIWAASTSARNKRKKIRLKTEGISYNAEIVRAYYNTKISIDGGHPLVIECSYTDKNGKTYLLKSDNIYNVPMSYISISITEVISATAWVNPTNPKDYYVDVEFADVLNAQEKSYDFDLR